jgi:hypothetical protein
MKHYFIFTILLLFNSFKFYSQQNTVASGGDYIGSNGSLSFSVGQIDYLNIDNASGNVNQGVQQPYQILDNSVNESDNTFEITIGPNPSFDVLIVQAEFSKMNDIQGFITDQNGKMVKERQNLSLNPSFKLNDLSSGNYFLQIENEQKLIKSYKIIKN